MASRTAEKPSGTPMGHCLRHHQNYRTFWLQLQKIQIRIEKIRVLLIIPRMQLESDTISETSVSTAKP
nr:hypothetical protein Iba_chr13aCG3110 [Ipomoea batatas]